MPRIPASGILLVGEGLDPDGRHSGIEYFIADRFDVPEIPSEKKPEFILTAKVVEELLEFHGIEIDQPRTIAVGPDSRDALYSTLTDPLRMVPFNL